MGRNALDIFREKQRKILTSRCDGVTMLTDAEFEEEKHPRDEGGKFAKKGAGSGNSGAENGKPEDDKGEGKAKKEASAAADKPKKAFESKILRTEEPKAFRRKFMTARNGQPIDKRWRVSSDYSEEDYADMDIFSTDAGSTVAVHNGDIVSVCKAVGDGVYASDLLAEAVRAGGVKLDSYSGNHRAYLNAGFVPESWCEWDDEYAPDDWKQANGFVNDDWKSQKDESGWAAKREPILFYRYVGKPKERMTEQQAQEHLKKFLSETKAAADYDAAYQARDAKIGKEGRAE